MTSARDSVATRAGIDRETSFAYQFTYLGANHVDPNYFTLLSARDDLHLSIGLVAEFGATVGGKWKFRNAVMLPTSFYLVFRKTYPSNLGRGVDHVGYCCVVNA